MFGRKTRQELTLARAQAIEALTNAGIALVNFHQGTKDQGLSFIATAVHLQEKLIKTEGL